MIQLTSKYRLGGNESGGFSLQEKYNKKDKDDNDLGEHYKTVCYPSSIESAKKLIVSREALNIASKEEVFTLSETINNLYKTVEEINLNMALRLNKEDKE